MVPGDEGIGEAVEVGKHVNRVKLGDRVVLSSRMLGTWRFYGIFHERELQVVTKLLPLAEGSMLTICPCVAYRLIIDFRKLNVGETIIQNAANSPTGQYVIQLCKAWGINTVNIVASHCGYEAVKEYLYKIGASAVYTIDEAEEIAAFNTSVTTPVLALNCLGGRFEDVMLKFLKRNGTIVYYGCAYDLPVSKKFFRPDADFQKFHLTKWDANASHIVKEKMYKDLIAMMILEKINAPLYQPLELQNYIHALKNTPYCEAFATSTYIFDFSLP